jgi:hypothetical protein
MGTSDKLYFKNIVEVKEKMVENNHIYLHGYLLTYSRFMALKTECIVQYASTSAKSFGAINKTSTGSLIEFA